MCNLHDTPLVKSMLRKIYIEIDIDVDARYTQLLLESNNSISTITQKKNIKCDQHFFGTWIGIRLTRTMWSRNLL